MMESSQRLPLTTLIAGLGLLLASCASDGAPQQEEGAMAAPVAMSGGGDGILNLPYHQRDLPNGMRVIIIPTDYPDIVTMQIPMQVGSRNEVEEGRTGFSHFFEHMMGSCGTPNFSCEEYETIMRESGADRSASASDDWTNYYATFTREDLETILEVQADKFINLSFTEDRFRTEAGAVLGEFNKNFASPVRRALSALRLTSYTEHSYSHTTMGFIEDIEIMPDQMEYGLQFFDRFYRPERATMILAGDLDPEETFAIVERYWGAWERGGYQEEIPVEPAPTGPSYQHEYYDPESDIQVQPWVWYAFRGPAFEPEQQDMPAMDLISQLYFSQNSDAYRQIVIEQQLADQFFTYFPDSADPGLLYIAARLTDSGNAADVRQIIFDTLADARTQLVDSGELERTKSRLKYNFTSNLSSSASIGVTVRGYAHFSRTPIETINALYRSYDSLTAEDIRRLANVYFTDERLVSLSQSNEPSMPGAELMSSLNATVSARGMSDMMPNSESPRVGRFEPGEHSGERPRIYARPGNSPLVDVMFQFRTGAAADPEGQSGLAALTAMMITGGGSQAHSIDEINELMYPLAAGFGARIGQERITLTGQVHQDNLDTWYEIVRGQLVTPGFREEDFERIRTQLINSIRSGLRGNNDEELGKEALYEFIYGEYHPYGTLRFGHVGDIERLTLDDVREFYAQNFGVGGLTVAMAGGFDQAFRSRVVGDMGYLPAGAPAEMEIPNPPTFAGRYARLIQKETRAVAVSFGFPIEVNRAHPDYVAMLVMQSWLGQHRSSNSWLFQRIRNIRGMNYGDYAYIEYFPNGMFQRAPTPTLAQSQQVFEVWLRPLEDNNQAMFATRTALFELEQLVAYGMTDETFETTRNFLRKSVSLLTASQSALLGYDLDSYFYGIPNYTEYVRRGLDRLTVDQVNTAISRHLNLGNIKFVMVTSDAAALAEAIENNWTSPMHYGDIQMDEDILAEDLIIQDIDLETLGVEIVPVEEVFESRTLRQP
jgi:zinc protease